MSAACPLPVLAPMTRGSSLCSACRESLPCSLLVVKFGAAGESGTVTDGPAVQRGSSPTLYVSENVLKLISEEEFAIRSLNLSLQTGDALFLNYVLIVHKILPVPGVKIGTL